MSDHSHLDKNGDFRSDKFPELPAGYIALSFRDPYARSALERLANDTPNDQLRRDIRQALFNTSDDVKPRSEVDHEHQEDSPTWPSL